MNQTPETLEINGYTYIRSDVKTMPDDCLAHRCTYYLHYLLHYDPREQGEKLEHSSYHEAERICQEWQDRLNTWMDDNPDKDPEIHNRSLIRNVVYWEQKVAA